MAKIPQKTLRKVLERATEVFESQDLAEEWMLSRVPALGDESPVNLLKQEGGERRVLEVLDKIETGDFS